jgi:(1->4)-alpha-D-glucan 1-alpha-D-glucosylmutase
MLKAMREAKAHTSWASPNENYEKAVSEFVRAVLTRGKKNRFLPDLGEFQRRVSRIGMFNSLSQTLLKLTSPGVPDIYQGNELWDYSLVDPDNRRPVDYERRRRMQEDLRSWQNSPHLLSHAHSLLDRIEDGSIKLYVTARVLCARKQNPALFQRGEYIPLKTSGGRADNVCAFARKLQGRVVIVAAPRLCATLTGEKNEAPVGAEVWGDTRIELPPGMESCAFRNIFTGEENRAGEQDLRPILPVSTVLSSFPVALLLADAEGASG